MDCPAVLLIIFKRPDTTRKVFEAIRKARPRKLFVAADGPRDRTGEAEACSQTRDIVGNVDWPCEVKTRFRDVNVGAGKNVAEAVTWFLTECSEGIVLEDDCLPHADFFNFAAVCLDKYRDDTRIMHISGSSFCSSKQKSSETYFFSRYNHGWGWATWKRAWERFDAKMTGLEDFLVNADRLSFWDSSQERKYWSKVFRQAQRGEMDAWDYQWKYSLWKESGLCLYPTKNLISNLGFGVHATNTFEDANSKGSRALEPLGDILHPEFVIRNVPADRENFKTMYWGTPVQRFSQRLKKISHLLRNES